MRIIENVFAGIGAFFVLIFAEISGTFKAIKDIEDNIEKEGIYDRYN